MYYGRQQMNEKQYFYKFRCESCNENYSCHAENVRRTDIVCGLVLTREWRCAGSLRKHSLCNAMPSRLCERIQPTAFNEHLYGIGIIVLYIYSVDAKTKPYTFGVRKWYLPCHATLWLSIYCILYVEEIYFISNKCWKTFRIIFPQSYTVYNNCPVYYYFIPFICICCDIIPICFYTCKWQK